jgi:pyruvate formate lyase activating enzyme
MPELGHVEAGSRHDLHIGLSPDAPDETAFNEDAEGAHGYLHSYETASRYDGPGLRVVLFVSGCLLRWPTPNLVDRVLEQFRAAGCRAR